MHLCIESVTRMTWWFINESKFHNKSFGFQNDFLAKPGFDPFLGGVAGQG